MIPLTAEQIVAQSQSETNTSLGTRRKINKLFRQQDDSHLWPVCNKFNVTERAIRKANKFEKNNGTMSPLEYALFIESESSHIVNNILLTTKAM